MAVSVLTLHLLLPGCTSLKEKRSQIQPVLARLHREFNVSTAEVDHQDRHGEAVLACAIVSTDAVHNQQVLQSVLAFTQSHWPDLIILADTLERVA